jgi:hypothetical protein
MRRFPAVQLSAPDRQASLERNQVAQRLHDPALRCLSNGSTSAGRQILLADPLADVLRPGVRNRSLENWPSGLRSLESRSVVRRYFWGGLIL